MPYTPRNSPHVLNLYAEVEDLREEIAVLRSHMSPDELWRAETELAIRRSNV
jgi:hypothetical protein